MSRFVQDLVPEEAKFLKTHEYILIDEGDDRARVGISHYAAEALGDIVYVELPDVGETFDRGDSFGSIESVKAASDIYMPVSGEIIAINTQLQEEPQQVNDDCYGSGWMIEIQLSKPEELERLLAPESYLSFLEESDD